MMFLAILISIYISCFLIFFYVYGNVSRLAENMVLSNALKTGLPSISKEDLMKIKMKLKNREIEDLDQLISKLRELRKRVEGVLNDF